MVFLYMQMCFLHTVSDLLKTLIVTKYTHQLVFFTTPFSIVPTLFFNAFINSVNKVK